MTIGLILGLIAALTLIGFLTVTLLKQKTRLKRFNTIVDLEAEQQKVKAVTAQFHKQNEKLKADQLQLKAQESELRQTLTTLKTELSGLESELDIQNYGLYQPKYDFGESQKYKDKLGQIRQSQKQMIRDKRAILCNTEWTVEGSAAKGRKMVDKQIRLMLRAFNGECDSDILKVKYNNVERIKNRISSAYKAINKLGEEQRCELNPTYLDLKLQELYLVHEYQEKLQEEREQQREIREQMREEQRAQREMEKAQIEAEKEEKRYQQALEKARREMEKATGETHDKLEGEIQRLNELLLEAQANTERAKSRASMTRSGHVYIISNIGSFGKEVFKIGMTRRLEPEERIRELSGASVPFLFDVHAMVYSEDAPALETFLHQTFDDKRVNRINARKEFFNVSLEEIEDVVHQYDSEAEFIHVPEAEEFRKTQAMITQEGIAR
jgi:hypothetical protein